MTIVRVTFRTGRWHVKIDGTGYEDGNGYSLKRDAMTAGRALARYLGAELIPHNIFGRMQTRGRSSFGHDPERSPG